MGDETPAAEPRWLDDDEQVAWRRLNRVITVLPYALDVQLQRDEGISLFEYVVLAMLSEAEGQSLQMKHLAAMSNGSLSRLSHVVSRLEKAGWVRRAPVEDDGRSTRAILTAEGLAKVVSAAPSHVENVRHLVFDGLRPDQVAGMHEIMGVILDRIACAPPN